MAVLMLPFQALKYSFQTHDRLCFVMEYANGGEVGRGPGSLVGWVHPIGNLRPHLWYRTDLPAQVCYACSVYLPTIGCCSH
jgi:hypothetical protein